MMLSCLFPLSYTCSVISFIVSFVLLHCFFQETMQQHSFLVALFLFCCCIVSFILFHRLFPVVSLSLSCFIVSCGAQLHFSSPHSSPLLASFFSPHLFLSSLISCLFSALLVFPVVSPRLVRPFHKRVSTSVFPQACFQHVSC